MKYTDLLVDFLLDEGFDTEEAERLIEFRAQWEGDIERENNRRQFARWLVAQGRLEEFEAPHADIPTIGLGQSTPDTYAA